MKKKDNTFYNIFNKTFYDCQHHLNKKYHLLKIILILIIVWHEFCIIFKRISN